MRDWIKILRYYRKLSQSEIAKKIGVTRQRVQQVCKELKIKLPHGKLGRKELCDWKKVIRKHKHLSATEIARKYKTAPSVVSERSKKYNIVLPKKYPEKTSHRRVNRIIGMYERGEVVSDISKLMRVHYVTIYRILKRNHITRRRNYEK